MNINADRIEQSIEKFSQLSIAFLMAFLGFALLPVAVLMLAYAEILRISNGVMLFDPHRASLMAFIVVAVYLILQTVRASLIYKTYGTMERPKWSARHSFRAISYKVGIGRNWSEQHTDSLERLESTSKIVAIVIILLGTLGSMEGRLNELSGYWYEAVAEILLRSTITDFITYIGGFAVTAALLRGMDWIIPYAYSLRFNQLDREQSQVTLVDDAIEEAIQRPKELVLNGHSNGNRHKD